MIRNPLEMWSYYGSKSKIAYYYPAPKHNTIIEPFAGAARYSLFYAKPETQVILCDKYQVVADLWRFLIERATPESILNLPILEPKENLDNYALLKEEKYLIGFFLNNGSAQPKKSPAKFNSWNAAKRQEIADNLQKIKHWKIFCGTYQDVPNENATWFIDPPYQTQGKWYQSSVNNKSINYADLADYCKTRSGQVIVCENIEAKWLPFKPLVSFHGQLHRKTEAIWTTENP